MTASEEVRQLRDAAVLWVVDGEFGRVVDAAVDCLVRGTSTPSLDILAGSSPSEPYSERLDLVRNVLDELDLPALPEDPDELAREAAGVQLRARSTGILSSTDLSSWVTGSLTATPAPASRTHSPTTTDLTRTTPARSRAPAPVPVGARIHGQSEEHASHPPPGVIG